MATITKSLTIESQGTYNLTFDLWSYSEWAASAGITTSYASLAALIADDKAVRQLMTVHASVDYFANCPDSTIISTVINNDLCAKWINLRDYAFDTLSAKSNIKSVMDTADKYGYGEWVYDGTSWGALGNVPIMTADNAPYGALLYYSIIGTNYAWYAFDNNPNTFSAAKSLNDTVEYIGYRFANPVCVKRVYVAPYTNSLAKFKVRGSNDGTTWVDIEEKTFTSNGYYDIDNADYYTCYSIQRTAKESLTNQQLSFYTLQFYGRELPVKQASAPTDGRKYIQIGSNYYTEDWGEKEFAAGSTRKTIYDHGVELVELQHDATGTGNIAANKGYEIYNKIQTMSGKTFTETTQKLVLSPYSILRAIVGDEYYRSNEGGVPLMLSTTSALVSVAYYANRLAIIDPTMAQVKQDPYNIYTIDISSVSQDGYLSYGNGYSSTSITSIGTLKEIWLE